jgi:16S rRNA (cytosine1402-N4)-methyltransferase
LTDEYRHVPVMLEEVLEALDAKPGDVVCDCTLGGAGHTVELAKRVAPEGLSIGIDQDDAALAAATERIEREVPDAEHLFLKGNFGDLDDLLVQAEVPEVDCFLFDLGVSSPQLDLTERGFSYREDAPLDMRMDPGNDTLTAAEVVNTYNEADLARVLRAYGDERHAYRIAREIVRRRQEEPIETTLQLVDVVKSAIPARDRRHGGHPARKTFQALRIEVNHELDSLERGLEAAIRWAAPGGRICVISYHSLEDRIVKHLFGEFSQNQVDPPDLPIQSAENVPILEVRTRRPMLPSEGEVERNPRARSAKMRVAVRLDATPEGSPRPRGRER